MRESGFRNQGKFCLWNPESWALEPRIQLKESRIPLTIESRIQVPLTKTGNQQLESGILGFGIRNTAPGILNPTNDRNPESKFHWQRLESSSWNLESTAWNPESKTVLDSLTLGDGNFVTKNWATFSGDVDIANNKIVNLANPTSNKDAVNKLYVDTNTVKLSSFTNDIGKFTTDW